MASKLLTVRVSEAGFDLLRAEARRRGLTVGAFVLAAVNEKIRRETVSPSMLTVTSRSRA